MLGCDLCFLGLLFQVPTTCNTGHPYSQQSEIHHITSFVDSRSFQVAVSTPNMGLVFSADSLHTLPKQWLQVSLSLYWMLLAAFNALRDRAHSIIALYLNSSLVLALGSFSRDETK